MRDYEILSKHNQERLYAGNFQNFKQCLETAVQEEVDLTGADLRKRNLANAELDDALLSEADFSYSNLSGANMSEAILNGACFRHAALYNTCLAYSDLSHCDFLYAGFGATDINGAILSGACFDGLSCFSLHFSAASEMHGCLYMNIDGQACSLSHPPIVIYGAAQLPIVFMDQHIKIGHKLIKHSHWLEALKKQIPTAQTP